MKKTYITPTVNSFDVLVENVVATSPAFYQTTNEADFVQGGQELGRDNNSSSSLWDQGW